jgi:hypothetical protein
VKALLRVDDKKELSNPPRVQEKELKEPEIISLSNQLQTETGENGKEEAEGRKRY